MSILFLVGCTTAIKQAPIIDIEQQTQELIQIDPNFSIVGIPYDLQMNTFVTMDTVSQYDLARQNMQTSLNIYSEIRQQELSGNDNIVIIVQFASMQVNILNDNILYRPYAMEVINNAFSHVLASNGINFLVSAEHDFISIIGVQELLDAIDAQFLLLSETSEYHDLLQYIDAIFNKYYILNLLYKYKYYIISNNRIFLNNSTKLPMNYVFFGKPVAIQNIYTLIKHSPSVLSMNIQASASDISVIQEQLLQQAQNYFVTQDISDVNINRYPSSITIDLTDKYMMQAKELMDITMNISYFIEDNQKYNIQVTRTWHEEMTVTPLY